MKLAYMLKACLGKEFVWGGVFAAALLAGCGGSGGNENSAISVATPLDDPARARQVTTIYAAAKQRDGASLLALKDAAARAHKPLDPAVTLSLYMLNSATSATDFIAAYPTDVVGVMLDYGSRLEAANLVPAGRRFPVKALGEVASKGDRVALGKLFGAFAVASEPISGEYGRQIAHAAALVPREALSAIAALPASQQLDVAAMQGWCGRSPAILAVPAGNAAETAVQTQIRGRLGNCPTPPPHKKRPHPKHKPGAKHKAANGKHKPAPKHTSKPQHH